MLNLDSVPVIEPSVQLALRRAVVAAGAAALQFQRQGCVVENKADASPVTEADRAAEAILLEALALATPGVPVVAEEEAAAGRIPALAEAWWLVDPLDGTKEFIQGGTDFTVNIGLIVRGMPVFGIVGAPARGMVYWGDVAQGEAWCSSSDLESTPKRIACCKADKSQPRAVASKSHNNAETEAYLAACNAGERVAIGSSLKFLLVACGEADVYPRAGPTMEWDTAAGDAILRAAGGLTFGLDGQPLRYGKPDFFNPGFLATGALTLLPLGPFCIPQTRQCP